MIYIKSLFNSLRSVIISYNKLAIALITYSLCFWRNIYYMICCSTRLTDSSSAHSVYDSLILDENLKCIIDGIVILCKCRCKCFCLRNCSWKSALV